MYYGQNVISKDLIIANRKELLNGNGFVLGVSGSGKSFTAKREMVNLALSTKDDIIVIDPESEYRPLIEGLGGYQGKAPTLQDFGPVSMYSGLCGDCAYRFAVHGSM